MRDGTGRNAVVLLLVAAGMAVMWTLAGVVRDMNDSLAVMRDAMIQMRGDIRKMSADMADTRALVGEMNQTINGMEQKLIERNAPPTSVPAPPPGEARR